MCAWVSHLSSLPSVTLTVSVRECQQSSAQEFTLMVFACLGSPWKGTILIDVTCHGQGEAAYIAPMHHHILALDYVQCSIFYIGFFFLQLKNNQMSVRLVFTSMYHYNMSVVYSWHLFTWYECPPSLVSACAHLVVKYLHIIPEYVSGVSKRIPSPLWAMSTLWNSYRVSQWQARW